MLSDRLVNFVNPLQGTRSYHGFSTGNCLPLVARPFGMTHWAPQTDEGGWWFHPEARKLQGIRATHQPSPWMGDYGHFVLMPQVGPLALGAEARASAFRWDQSVVKPHIFKTHLIRYRTTLELTPTERCAALRLTFPEAETARLILQPFPGDSAIEVSADRTRLSGFTRARTGGAPDSFACYFVVTFSRPCNRAVLFADDHTTEAARKTGDRVGTYVEWETDEGSVIEARIATSFISIAQAERNLEQETGDRSFEDLQVEAERVWNETLGVVEIEGATERQRQTFYSCLYRANLFPRLFHEYDAEGRPIHYSPYDGLVHDGVQYTDNGFWDTYRTVYSLLSILYPKRWVDILNGWVNAAKEGGWFPRWASPGYRAVMIGTHIDAVMADAATKGVQDIDWEVAYRALRRNAFEVGHPHGNYGRRGIEEFGELGYVPVDQDYESATARTLDYAYNDWCIAQVAHNLGHEDDYQALISRSSHYRNVYDPGVGFMRGRNADGSWQEPFREFAWGGPYVEGGPWQSSWAVPHDPAGLIELMGGPDAFVAKLDRLLALPPHFEVGTYGGEIHEMTEMAAADFGQYAQSNQPVHHVLFLYACAGRPDKTQYWVRRVLDELYTPDDLPGDEDNGEMASWYILNALGVYPLCPGHPTYILGSPLFPQAVLHLENGKTLTITAENNSPQNVYVQSLAVNGRPHDKTWIAHDVLTQGSELRLLMGDVPRADQSFSADDLPYSLSHEDAKCSGTG